MYKTLVENSRRDLKALTQVGSLSDFLLLFAFLFSTRKLTLLRVSDKLFSQEKANLRFQESPVSKKKIHVIVAFRSQLLSKEVLISSCCKTGSSSFFIIFVGSFCFVGVTLHWKYTKL
jgi:hypothetical protein